MFAFRTETIILEACCAIVVPNVLNDGKYLNAAWKNTRGWSRQERDCAERAKSLSFGPRFNRAMEAPRIPAMFNMQINLLTAK